MSNISQNWRIKIRYTFRCSPHRFFLARFLNEFSYASLAAEFQSRNECSSVSSLRTRAHELCFSSFKRHVLDELNADLAVALTMNTHYDYENPFWQHAKYRWTAPEFDDIGQGFDLAQRWICAERDLPPRGLARAPCGERHLAGAHSVTGTAAYCVLDTDILSLASVARPASGRGARSLRPLRRHSLGLLLAFLHPPLSILDPD